MTGLLKHPKTRISYYNTFQIGFGFVQDHSISICYLHVQERPWVQNSLTTIHL